MRTLRCRWQDTALACFILAAMMCPALAAGASRWTVPSGSPAPAQLPRLTQPLVLDGELREWADAACVPMRDPTYLWRLVPPRKWNGPADAAAEIYCAWNADGLCFAAVVTDDDIRIAPGIHERNYRRFYKEDLLQFFLDGRAPEGLMRSPVSTGCYTISVKPPLPDGPPEIFVDEPQDSVIEGLRAAGRRTPTGYVIEALVPWSGFPKFIPRPGAPLGLQFRLNDYDLRTAQDDSPAAMSWDAAWLDEHPESFIKWVLVERPESGPGVWLGPLAVLSARRVGVQGQSIPITIETTAPLAARLGRVSVQIRDPEGRLVLSRSLSSAPLPAPWSASSRAQVTWTPQATTDGFYIIRAVLRDRTGQPLGYVRRPVLFADRILETSIARLEPLNLPALSQTEPFRAAACLGVAAALERLKIAKRSPADPATVAQTVQEVIARLDLLDKGPLHTELLGLCDLLLLAGDPEAQVVVEYSLPDYGPVTPYSVHAGVTLYWGALPLATVDVRQAGSEEEAQKTLSTDTTWVEVPQTREATVAGRPARFWLGRMYARLEPQDFVPDRQVLAASISRKEGVVFRLDQLDSALVDAVLVLSDCPAAVRQAVEAWAKQKNLPLVDIAGAAKEDRVLVAGDIRSQQATPLLNRFELYSSALEPAPGVLLTVVGDRVLRAYSAVPEVSIRAAELVIAGKPITPEEVDGLRAALVKALAPAMIEAPVIPAGLSLFCGDVHMHTSYSDGNISPVGLMLEAIYSFHDFAVITDHERIDGAQLAQKLLAEHGFAYPVIVGEEITNETFHMNAYPLRKVVPTKLSPQKTIAAAHAQNAVIQWNHPWLEDDPWVKEHFSKGIAGTGLDAWEHFPPRYEEWKASGTLPVIVGSTDTHSGTFDWPERTIVFAPSTKGEDVAQAIRTRQVVALFPHGNCFYGPNDSAISAVWAALAEGKQLKAATEERLRHTLAHADLAGLLKANAPTP